MRIGGSADYGLRSGFPQRVLAVRSMRTGVGRAIRPGLSVALSLALPALDEDRRRNRLRLPIAREAATSLSSVAKKRRGFVPERAEHQPGCSDSAKLTGTH